ncbi:MAG: FecCD family ABC transporter permease [Granulosicoccaceae bacterium]
MNRLLATLCCLVLALFMLSLSIGTEPIPLWQSLIDWLAGNESVQAVIVAEIRLPRALIACLAGATLGLCGAAMQGLLRNPLASPGLVGSSSGAALFAVLFLYFYSGTAGTLLLPLVGMGGALGATVLVYALAGRHASITTLILAGVAINALATALMSLLLNLAPSPYAVRELVLWTLGDLSDRSMQDFWLMLPPTLLGWGMLIGIGYQLSALTLGEQTAGTLGINTQRLRWRVFIAVALAVGASVATTGMIGFIGLAVPHLLRPLVAHDPAKLLPASALGGAVMLLAADICVRLIPTQTPLKVGVVTALVGAPFFLHLVLRSRKEYV